MNFCSVEKRPENRPAVPCEWEWSYNNVLTKTNCWAIRWFRITHSACARLLHEIFGAFTSRHQLNTYVRVSLLPRRSSTADVFLWLLRAGYCLTWPCVKWNNWDVSIAYVKVFPNRHFPPNLNDKEQAVLHVPLTKTWPEDRVLGVKPQHVFLKRT